MSNIKIEQSWLDHLEPEFSKKYMQDLKVFLSEEKKSGSVIFPPNDRIFQALNSTSFENVKVVILGQDPYHGPGQAHGLSFSVNKGVKTPPSLKNIYKELQDDVGFIVPDHGFLIEWADQGVLLLNAVLTVRANTPGSHQQKGWELFTDKIIQMLSEQREHLVFLLWGNYAKGKLSFIDQSKHLVLTAAHPSPFSAYQGFFGSKHFSKTNIYLTSQGITPIDWQIH